MLCILVSEVATLNLKLEHFCISKMFTILCIPFRVGGVLKILGFHRFLNKGALRRFLLSCQSKVPMMLLFL